MKGMDMLRDIEIKMIQTEILKIQNVLSQMQNIFGRIKISLATTDANITQRHRSRNNPERNYPFLKYKNK